MAINKEILQGKWNQIKGKVIQRWGKLTDDDISQMRGNFDELKGKLQERYGFSKEKAETELNQFLSNIQSQFSSSQETHSGFKSASEGFERTSHSGLGATSKKTSTIKDTRDTTKNFNQNIQKKKEKH